MWPSPPELAARRARLYALLGDAAALVLAPRVAYRNHTSEYRYRTASDLSYLTGFQEPETAALFRPYAEQPFVLFVRPRDQEKETWSGRRAGLEGARERFGADAAFPWSELESRLGPLLQGAAALHYAFGGPHDALVLGALADRDEIGARNGAPMPDTLVDLRRLTGELRLHKTAEELDLLRRAAAITVDAHRRAMGMGRPGTWEYQVEAEIEATFRRAGGNGPGYGTIVGAGANACILHYVDNRDALQDGDLCLVDAGCEVGNYTADVTRTWPVGGRFTGPQRDLYEVVLAAQKAGVAEVRPGRTLRHVHHAALRVLVEGMAELSLLEGDVDELIHSEAYRRCYMHGIGHWLGLDVHDAGRYFRGGEARPFAPGQVVTVEPGLYVRPDDEESPAALRGLGIRIEDDVLVTAEGPENLTAALPKEIADVEAACR